VPGDTEQGTFCINESWLFGPALASTKNMQPLDSNTAASQMAGQTSL